MTADKSVSNWKTDLAKLRRRVVDAWRKLSEREKIILTVLSVVLFISGLYQIYIPIEEAFEKQSMRMENAERDLEQLSMALSRYITLRQRREEIEEAYKQVEIKEGVVPYLENLIRNKAGITSGFTIRDRPLKTFGGNYEQSSYAVKFVISDYPRLVEFLTELVQGSQPLILATIKMEKRLAGDAVSVDLDVSSIRKKP